MHLFLKFAVFFCILACVAPEVNIPAIFQKPKKKIEIPAPKTLDIREATSEEFNCVGRPNGNHANLKDCMSFYACVKNQTYFVVCPEFPGYQTYFNPVKRLCDKSDPLACLTEVQLDENIEVTTDEAGKGEDQADKKDSLPGENDSDKKDSSSGENDSDKKDSSPGENDSDKKDSSPGENDSDKKDSSSGENDSDKKDSSPGENDSDKKDSSSGENDSDKKDSSSGENESDNKNSEEDNSNESTESEEDHKSGQENSGGKSGEEIDSDEDETKSNHLDDEL